MSFEAYKWVRDHSESRLATRLTMYSVADHADAEGKHSYPGIETIMRETGLSRSAVYECLRAAVSLNELRIAPNQSPLGTDLYTLCKMNTGVQSLDSGSPDSGRESPDSGKSRPDSGKHCPDSGLELKDFNLTNEPIHKPKAPVLPDWLPMDSWNGFVEHRKKTKPPLSDRAIVLILRKLQRLRDQGHDPEVLLDTAVERGWKSVFPPSDNGRKPPASLSDRNERAFEQWKRKHPEEKIQ